MSLTISNSYSFHSRFGSSSSFIKRENKVEVGPGALLVLPQYVHVVNTRVRKLYCCQVLIVRQSLDAPLSQARYWASSDLEADPPTLLIHIATRWDIEVLKGSGKEELGLDQYQVLIFFRRR